MKAASLWAHRRLAIGLLAGSLMSACGGGGSSGPTPPATAPTVSLTASPELVLPGEASRLSWSTQNATACTASEAWTGSKNVLGSEATPPLSAATTFTLTCAGPGGSVSRSVTVGLVQPRRPEPPLAVQGALGDSAVTVSWQSQVGSYFDGHLVSSNVYLSTRPQIDPATFRPTGDDRVLRGLREMAPVVLAGLSNGTAVYVVVTDVANGQESRPSPEIRLTPRPMPALVERMAALNDTGVDRCVEDLDRDRPCPVATLPRQDAEAGRDALARQGVLPKTGFGRAGFDFTKIDAAGAPLPAEATLWPCVQDNTTGLTWGVPGHSPVAPALETYSWYESDERVHGGQPGSRAGGACRLSQCDTQGFIEALNAAALCGHRDWRLPTRRELLSLVDFGTARPAFDTTVFPFLPPWSNAFFWSSTVAAATASVGVAAWAVDVSTGQLLVQPKDGFVGIGNMPATVLAVRSPVAP